MGTGGQYLNAEVHTVLFHKFIFFTRYGEMKCKNERPVNDVLRFIFDNSLMQPPFYQPISGLCFLFIPPGNI